MFSSVLSSLIMKSASAAAIDKDYADIVVLRSGDSLGYHKDKALSTKDADHSGGKCTVKYQGAWWFRNCHYANLNGRYIKEKEKVPSGDGIQWRKFTGLYGSLKAVNMKMRPAGFTPGEAPNTLPSHCIIDVSFHYTFRYSFE